MPLVNWFLLVALFMAIVLVLRDPLGWPSFILAGGWQQPRGECHRDARALAGKVPKRKLVRCSSGGAESFGYGSK